MHDYRAAHYPQISPYLTNKLCASLAKTDQVAHANVTHDEQGLSIVDAQGRPIKGRFSRGGPFGALLGISYDDLFDVVGEMRGNNVVGSGIASRHAEDQAMQADNYECLVQALSSLSTGKQNPFVWMVSSGQSCTTCHTKQEIMARNLVSRKLIAPDRFVTLYGATYDETFKIAQFYDAQYADALYFFSRQPEHPGNLIRHESIGFGAIPNEVRYILKNATRPTAVIMRQGKVYAIGQESRTAFDLFSTAEVCAVRNACTQYRKDEEARTGKPFIPSWTVDGELYTTTQEIGPLLFAEAGWTHIGTVKSVKMPRNFASKRFETRETPDLDNAAFLQIIAGGYRHPQAAIAVFRDEGFKNTAQPQWAEMLRINNEQLYNGAAVSPYVERMRNIWTRTAFAAPDIRNCNGDARPQRMLEALAI